MTSNNIDFGFGGDEFKENPHFIEPAFKFFLPYRRQDTQHNCCELRLFISNRNAPQIVLITEIAANRGSSITNAIEFVIPQAITYLKSKVPQFTAKNCVFVEHYNCDSEIKETFDLVRPQAPMWRSFGSDNFGRAITGNFDFSADKDFISYRWLET